MYKHDEVVNNHWIRYFFMSKSLNQYFCMYITVQRPCPQKYRKYVVGIEHAIHKFCTFYSKNSVFNCKQLHTKWKSNITSLLICNIVHWLVYQYQPFDIGNWCTIIEQPAHQPGTLIEQSFGYCNFTELIVPDSISDEWFI